jgi:uncharacterized protein YeaO (DUF488 family)
MIRIKRLFEAAAPEDGRHFLVDRLWPRGMIKAALVTLLYAASDSDHNNAIVLRDYLLTRQRRIEAKEGPPSLVHRI